MKPINLLKSMLVLATVVVTSCSAPKLAQKSMSDDDVYATTAKMKEYVEPQRVATTTDTDNQEDEYYGTSDPYYDMDYASRINRFYYSSPWRSYYDNFYTYSYYPWYSPSYSFGIYYNNFGFYNRYYNPYSWGYYNYYSPYYGIYSYGSPYYWGGSYYGGGYWGNNRNVYVNPNYGARPARGRDGNINYTPDRYGAGGRPGGVAGTRTGTTNQGRPVVGGNTTDRPTRTSTNTDNRPTRTSNTDNRPTRTSEAPAGRPAERQYTPPPNNNSGGGGRTESGGGGGAGRPGRGGR